MIVKFSPETEFITSIQHPYEYVYAANEDGNNLNLYVYDENDYYTIRCFDFDFNLTAGFDDCEEDDWNIGTLDAALMDHSGNFLYLAR